MTACCHPARKAGSCAIRQAPCHPRATFRRRRRLLVQVSALGTLALLALSLPGGLFQADPGWFTDPGALNAVHSSFIEADRCDVCHQEHLTDARTWLRALTTSVDVSQRCAACHDFDGDRWSAHNRSFPDRGDIGTLACLACHTEHKGIDGRITTLTQSQCHSCHKGVFTRFDLDFSMIPIAERLPQGEDSDFSSGISSQALDPLLAAILGIKSREILEYSPPVYAFLRDLAGSGPSRLFDSVKALFPDADTGELLKGLGGDLLSRAAKAWVANLEYDPIGEPRDGGWWADFLTFRYRPIDHKDPVLKAWIEALTDSSLPADLAVGLLPIRDRLLRADGPGHCFKCHRAEPFFQAGSSRSSAWTSRPRNKFAQTHFDHRPHLNLFGRGEACKRCHNLSTSAVLDKETGASISQSGGLSSEFDPILINRCAECHQRDRVRQDCNLCHRYHSSTRLTVIQTAQPQPHGTGPEESR